MWSVNAGHINSNNAITIKITITVGNSASNMHTNAISNTRTTNITNIRIILIVIVRLAMFIRLLTRLMSATLN